MPRASRPGGWVYVLSLILPRPTRTRIGALGTFTFPPGYYLYTGSARRAAAARLARHARARKPLRWHIDYLRRFASLDAIRLYPASQETECGLARNALRRPGARIVARRFGSSDCRCPAHLVFLAGPRPGHGRGRSP